MSCEIFDWSKGPCAENGGIDEIVAYAIEDRASLSFANNVISALTLASGAKGHRIIPDMESSNFTEATTRNRQNNTKMSAQTGLIVLKDDDLATVQFVEQLSSGFWGIIAKKSMADGTSSWRHYGLLNGMVVTTADGTLGQLYEDPRSHTINLAGKELTKAPEVSNSIVQALLTPTS